MRETAIIALLLALATQSGSAQITVNQSDTDVSVGHTVRTQITTANLSLDWDAFAGGSGGSQVWDFSSIVFVGNPIGVTVVDVNTVPMNALFMGATAAWKPEGYDSWTLFSTPPDQILMFGFVNIGQFDIDSDLDTSISVFESPELQFQFPITLGSSWISEFQYSTDYGSLSVTVHDSVENVVDAWGIIRYNNNQMPALRIKGTHLTTSTTGSPGVPPVVTTSSYDYLQFIPKRNLTGISLIRSQSGAQVYYSGSADTRIIDGVCGDIDASGRVDIADAVFLLNYVFARGPLPLDSTSGDLNCDSRVNITDIVFLVNYLFAGGPAPCALCS